MLLLRNRYLNVLCHRLPQSEVHLFPRVIRFCLSQHGIVLLEKPRQESITFRVCPDKTY